MNVSERLAQAITPEGMLDDRYARALPAGSILLAAFTTSPSDCLKANGAAYSRTTYKSLFAAIGTTFGAGDGSTTFNVPDMRGLVPRGHDDGRGLDSGRVFGSYQEDAIRNLTGAVGFHNGTSNGIAATTIGTASGMIKGGNQYNYWGSLQAANTGATSYGYLSLDASLIVPTAAENRMKSLALAYFIKY